MSVSGSIGAHNDLLRAYSEPLAAVLPLAELKVRRSRESLPLFSSLSLLALLPAPLGRSAASQRGKRFIILLQDSSSPNRYHGAEPRRLECRPCRQRPTHASLAAHAAPAARIGLKMPCWSSCRGLVRRVALPPRVASPRGLPAWPPRVASLLTLQTLNGLCSSWAYPVCDADGELVLMAC